MAKSKISTKEFRLMVVLFSLMGLILSVFTFVENRGLLPEEIGEVFSIGLIMMFALAIGYGVSSLLK